MAARKRLFVAAFLCGLWTLTESAQATCPIMSKEELFAYSRAVFVGHAVSQRIVTRASPGVTETTFEVEESWKGAAGSKTLVVQTCGFIDDVSAITCGAGYRFVVGSRYLVFASGDPLTASTECDGHITLLEKAEALLKGLSDHPAPHVLFTIGHEQRPDEVHSGARRAR